MTWTCLGCGNKQVDGWAVCSLCGFFNWDPLRFVVHGRAVSQKNRRDIVRIKTANGEKWLSVAEPEVKAWQKAAFFQLVLQANARKAKGLGDKDHELVTTITAYLGEGQHLDADNIAAAPLDALQRAGIVSNDYWCAPLHVYRERDPHDPRIEIRLEPKWKEGKQPATTARMFVELAPDNGPKR